MPQTIETEAFFVNKKVTDIVAYITWIGLIIAFVAGDRENCKFHLNQALVIWLAGIIFGVVGIIPILGTIIAVVGGILCFVCWILGLIGAVQGTEKPVPLLGKIRLLK